MGSPFFQNVDPAATPPSVTPQAGPADAAGWDAVTPEGPGPADYDISAPQSIDAITSAFDAANALTGAGVLYPKGPRQQEAEALLTSPQGAGEMSVTSGFPNYESTDVSPGANMANPIQSQGPSSGPYPGTLQDGVPQFMAGLGGDRPGSLPGVTPETGTMSDEGDESGNAGGHYPGTTQSGLPMYGTG